MDEIRKEIKDDDIKDDDILKSIQVAVSTTSGAEKDILRAYELHADADITKPSDAYCFIFFLGCTNLHHWLEESYDVSFGILDNHKLPH